MRRLFAGICVLTLLTACEATLKGPSAELGWSKAKIQSGSGFCPPGQAKKGNC